MKFATHIKPISYLKSHAAEIVKDLSDSHEPMLITQNGEAKLVVMDVQSYERQEETLALLKILAMGNRDIEQGRFRDAEDIFHVVCDGRRDMRSLLARRLVRPTD